MQAPTIQDLFDLKRGIDQIASDEPRTVCDMAWVDANGLIRVYDANGVELKRLLRCVVETGECLQLATEADGSLMLDYDKNEIVRKVAWYPAPLRVEKVS